MSNKKKLWIEKWQEQASQYVTPEKVASKYTFDEVREHMLDYLSRDGGSYIRKELEDFDIEKIAKSGQSFRIEKIDDTLGLWRVLASGRSLKVAQIGAKVYFDCTDQEFETFWKNYFDLDTNYRAFIKAVDGKDQYLKRAVKFAKGIRILNQDLWEMIVSFLISQQNNIARITKCVENLCETYGEQKKDKAGNIYYIFPTAETLARLEDDDLKACNLGYRSKYVVQTARAVASGEVNLELIQTMSYKEAKKELLKLFGVGPKVADCICLFALHHLEAFPVDTHIKQVLEAHYKEGFPFERYAGFEGVLQQYIFYYDLHHAE